MFNDRIDAGKQLAKALQHYKNEDGVILAVPRGGVEIGSILATALSFPLEIVLSKKIGHPNQPEYAIGAVSLESRVVADHPEVSEEYINQETNRLRGLLRERYKKYYGNHQPVSLKGKTAIIVDDGIATGHTLLSSIELIRHQKPQRIIVAIPVAPVESLRHIEEAKGVDEVVCLLTPMDFRSVGQYYRHFDQVEDAEVIRLLHAAWLQKWEGGKPLTM